MTEIKEHWKQLVNSTTINEEIEAIRKFSKITKENNSSFSLFIIDKSGKRIHYNDFTNQNIAHVSIDFNIDGTDFTVDHWKPLDTNNISLFFLE